MWVKTDLPEPVMRELEDLIRMAQALMNKPEQAEEPAKPIEFAVQHGESDRLSAQKGSLWRWNTFVGTPYTSRHHRRSCLLPALTVL